MRYFRNYLSYQSFNKDIFIYFQGLNVFQISKKLSQSFNIRAALGQPQYTFSYWGPKGIYKYVFNNANAYQIVESRGKSTIHTSISEYKSPDILPQLTSVPTFLMPHMNTTVILHAPFLRIYQKFDEHHSSYDNYAECSFCNHRVSLVTTLPFEKIYELLDHISDHLVAQ